MVRWMRWPLPWPKSWRQKSEPQAAGPGPEGEPTGEAAEEKPKSLRRSALLFLRDLAIAFLVVALVMAALFAYTGVWPPMVVVESASMQHSNTESFIGVIDTGDLVLVQDVAAAGDVVTYIEGRATGHSTYGDYGDVIVFIKPGAASASTPLIHRAMAYVVRNETAGADVPALARLPLGAWSARSTNGSIGNYARGIWEFTLRDVGYLRQPQPFNATQGLLVGQVSAGFLTKGDHNTGPDGHGAVALDRIVGKARGELPWFGLLKLTLSPGDSGCCPQGWGDRLAPANSWDALLVSIVLIIVGPFLADFGWSYWKGRRKRRAERRESERPPEAPPPEGIPEAPPSPPSGSSDVPPDPEVTDEDRTESAGPGAGGP